MLAADECKAKDAALQLADQWKPFSTTIVRFHIGESRGGACGTVGP